MDGSGKGGNPCVKVNNPELSLLYLLYPRFSLLIFISYFLDSGKVGQERGVQKEENELVIAGGGREGGGGMFLRDMLRAEIFPIHDNRFREGIFGGVMELIFRLACALWRPAC